MTTVDLSWKLRARKAESQLAERERELQQAREEIARTESARVELKLELLEAIRVVAEVREERDEQARGWAEAFKIGIAHQKALSEAREEITRLKEALTSVHADHTRSLSSGTGKITECTCRTCQVLHPVPEKTNMKG